MGTVLRFPTERVRGALIPSYHEEPAEILILPVVQVEREAFGYAAAPGAFAPGDDDTRGKRRRRGPRS
jgi:hypothetical protein